ncbi:MAG: hypothetical protein ABH811_03100, partial [archaeon]
DSLTQGENFNFSWVMNVTSSSVENYLVDVLVNSSFGSANVPDNNSEDRLVVLNPEEAPANTAPNDPTVSLVSLDYTNKTLQDLNCSALITDNDAGAKLNVTVLWIKNKGLNQTIYYNNSYSNATMFSAILESENTTKTDNWTCSLKLFDGTDYSSFVNSTNLTILNTLPTVTLLTPDNYNVTTNRTQKFTWSGSDDDNDALTYQINITLTASSTCSDPDRDDASISNTYYIPSPYMNCLQDNGDYYNWTVRASDDGGSTYGGWADSRRIDYQSSIIIAMVNDTVSFGGLGMSATNNTTDNSPLPFLIRNDGNCFLNISLNSTNLWNSVVNPSEYFQYKVDNKSEENGSFDWILSKTTWQNVPDANYEMVIVNFNWSDETDSAEVDILVTVPSEEGSGDRESTLGFKAELGE